MWLQTVWLIPFAEQMGVLRGSGREDAQAWEGRKTDARVCPREEGSSPGVRDGPPVMPGAHLPSAELLCHV